MVFPTSTSMSGQSSGDNSKKEPSGALKRFPDVYASVRVVENWEMMKVAEELCQAKDDTKCTQFAGELVHKGRMSQLFHECSETCKGKTEAMYQVLLSWRQNCNGLALVGDLAKRLRKHGFRELAESFPP